VSRLFTCVPSVSAVILLSVLLCSCCVQVLTRLVFGVVRTHCRRLCLSATRRLLLSSHVLCPAAPHQAIPWLMAGRAALVQFWFCVSKISWHSTLCVPPSHAVSKNLVFSKLLWFSVPWEPVTAVVPPGRPAAGRGVPCPVELRPGRFARLG